MFTEYRTLKKQQPRNQIGRQKHALDIRILNSNVERFYT